MSTISQNPQIIDTTAAAGNFVGVHVLTPVVGVNLNANQDGTPKQIRVGDANRLRISSQAKKRAMREWTHQFIKAEDQAVRTREIPGAAARRVAEALQAEFTGALDAVAALILSVGKFTIDAAHADRTKELAFVPRSCVDQVAEIAIRNWGETELIEARARIAEHRGAAEAAAAAAPKGRKAKTSAKDNLEAVTLSAAIKQQVLFAFAPGASAEIALNGRMLTALPETGAVEAAGAVAHAYSVDPVVLTADEWTAKDDWQDDGFDEQLGAAMLDTRVLSSGTLYQYAALDRRLLRSNLAQHSGAEGEELDELCADAERLFVSSVAWAMPAAKKTSTGSKTPPVLVVATTTDTAPLTLPVFAEAITDDVSATAAARIANYLRRMDRFNPISGGTVLWMPPTDAEAPQFPDALTIQD